MSNSGKAEEQHLGERSEVSGSLLDISQESAWRETTSTNLPPSWVDPARNQDDNRSLMLRTAILPLSAELLAIAKSDQTLTDGPCLIFGSGKAQGTAIDLVPMEQKADCTWIIGCEANCDILMNEVGVSAFHAMVVHKDGQWTLVDQQSASGTFVNGKPCLKKVLNDGDQLQFGHIKCTFHLPEHYRSHRASRPKRWLQAVKAVVAAQLALLARRTS